MTTNKNISKSTDKVGIQLLARLCRMKGVKHAVISPGSRNAPLSVAFNREVGINTTVIVDERSAGFYALGIAQQTLTPVVVICTSGTALLNLAPAVAEAYYQQIPLIVISADRPLEWIDQDDSQTIRQQNIFVNIAKYSCTLKTDPLSDIDMWYNNRIINEAINISLEKSKGPVHINVPLEEPLCSLSEKTSIIPRVISNVKPVKEINENFSSDLAKLINNSLKVMIVVSMNLPDEELNHILNSYSAFPQIVILTETISNLKGDKFISNIDRTLSRIKGQQLKSFSPDLIISFGGPILSKMLKRFIRDYKPTRHWYIGEQSRTIDTFNSLTQKIECKPKYNTNSMGKSMGMLNGVGSMDAF